MKKFALWFFGILFVLTMVGMLSPGQRPVVSEIAPTVSAKPELKTLSSEASKTSEQTSRAESRKAVETFDQVRPTVRSPPIRDSAKPGSKLESPAKKKLASGSQKQRAERPKPSVKNANKPSSKRIETPKFQQLSGPRPRRAPLFGTCECPYDTDRAGRRCGRRSAFIRDGGRSGYQCYLDPQAAGN